MSSSNPENPNGEMKQDVESGKISSNAVPSQTGVDSTPPHRAHQLHSKKAAPKGSTSTSDASNSKENIDEFSQAQQGKVCKNGRRCSQESKVGHFP